MRSWATAIMMTVLGLLAGGCTSAPARPETEPVVPVILTGATIDATVDDVRGSNDTAVVTISRGSADGVEFGMALLISRDGAYVATLRVISVEASRSTGVVESPRGDVRRGDRVMGRR